MKRLPLDFGIFWKTFVIVAVLVVVGWWAVIALGLYEEMTPADYVGTTISTILLSYLIHLWILPAEVLRGDEGEASEESAEKDA